MFSYADGVASAVVGNPGPKIKSWDDQMETLLASSHSSLCGDLFELFTEEFRDSVVFYISLILHHQAYKYFGIVLLIVIIIIFLLLFIFLFR